MKMINPAMKVSEAARLVAAMNARLMARPGRLEIEKLPDLDSSRFKQSFLAGHGLVHETTQSTSHEARRGAGEAFFNKGVRRV